MGTIINTIAIILGGIFGLVFGRLLNEKIQNSIVTSVGVCVLFIGANGTLSNMNNINNSGVVIITSIILGTIIGEILKIDFYIEKFGEWLKKKSNSSDDNSFVNGFVTASVTVCVGAMAVIGSIQDGILGDSTVLITKSMLDLIVITIMTSSMGKGCIFSAIPVLIFQGSITVLSKFIEPIMTDTALLNLDVVGSILIFCIGINLVWNRKIKVANMLPAIFIAVIWAFL